MVNVGGGGQNIEFFAQGTGSVNAPCEVVDVGDIADDESCL